MIINEIVKRYLRLIELEFEYIQDYVNLELLTYEDLEKGQVGYSIDSRGNSLIKDKGSSWDVNWIVIGHETLCGDPIIIDLSEEGYPISSLMHGMGDWEGGTPIAKSIENFYTALVDIKQFVKDKKLNEESRKLFIKEFNSLVNKIVNENDYVDFDNWKSLLWPLFSFAEEYERDIKNKINSYKGMQLGISEIAKNIGLPIKDIYDFMKKIKE